MVYTVNFIGSQVLNIQLYVSIYNKQYWEFNILPQCEIKRDGKYREICIKFLFYAVDVVLYNKDKPYLEKRMK